MNCGCLVDRSSRAVSHSKCASQPSTSHPAHPFHSSVQVADFVNSHHSAGPVSFYITEDASIELLPNPRWALRAAADPRRVAAENAIEGFAVAQEVVSCPVSLCGDVVLEQWALDAPRASRHYGRLYDGLCTRLAARAHWRRRTLRRRWSGMWQRTAASISAVCSGAGSPCE